MPGHCAKSQKLVVLVLGSNGDLPPQDINFNSSVYFATKCFCTFEVCNDHGVDSSQQRVDISYLC